MNDIIPAAELAARRTAAAAALADMLGYLLTAPVPAAQASAEARKLAEIRAILAAFDWDEARPATGPGGHRAHRARRGAGPVSAWTPWTAAWWMPVVPAAAPPLAPPARRTSWSVGCPGLQRGLGHWIISLSEIVRAYVAGA